MGRAKGFLPDHPGTNYPASHKHLVSATAPRQATPTLTRFRAGSIYQDGVSGCLGAAASRGIQLWSLANGHGLVLPSWLAAYINGRLEEYAGMDPESVPPLEDFGSRPDMVLRAFAERGCVLEDDFPSLANVARKNERVPDDALVKGYEMRGLLWAPIESRGGAKIDALKASLLRFQPVIYSQFVDTAVENYDGNGIITSIDWSDPDGGDHMLCILAADQPDAADVDNWWRDDELGVPWGRPDGTFRISYDILESDHVQMFAIQGVAPQLRSP